MEFPSQLYGLTPGFSLELASAHGPLAAKGYLPSEVREENSSTSDICMEFPIISPAKYFFLRISLILLQFLSLSNFNFLSKSTTEIEYPFR